MHMHMVAALWIRKAAYYIRSTVPSELFRSAAFFGASLSSNFASRQRFRNSLTTFCLDMKLDFRKGWRHTDSRAPFYYLDAF